MKRLVLALLVAAGVAGMAALRLWPSGPQADWKPRIVILMAIDTCRADHLGCYGYPRPTSPNLDRMAAQGVLFERAFSQANESLFSYASIFTGRYPERLGRLDYDYLLPRHAVTLAGVLHGSGFRTAAFVAGGHLSHVFGFSRGFDVYQDGWDFGSLHSTFPPAVKWLARLPADAHALVLLHGYDAHAPYLNALFGGRFDPGYHGIADRIIEIPDASDNICNGRYFSSLPTRGRFVLNRVRQRVLPPQVFAELARMAREHRGQRLRPADIRHLVAQYDACLSYADIYVGLLLARLQELHLERQTLVVLIGDHGEDLMEHGFFNHRAAVNDSCVHVPLILWGPGGLPEGRRVPQPVQLVDVMPTILDYLGIHPSGSDVPSPGRKAQDGDMDGRSLRPLVDRLPGAPVRAGGGEGLAYSEGILPMITVRSRDARLIFEGTSRQPLTALNARDYRFYRIGPGEREQRADVHGVQAARLADDLRRWQQELQSARKPGRLDSASSPR